MKNGKKGNLFLLFALAILVSSPFAFAGLSDWWAEFTGKATTQTTSASVTITNNAPTISAVNITGPLNTSFPNESIGLKITVQFNATDVDGAANINDSTASLNLSVNDSVYYQNTSCNTGFIQDNGNTVAYLCTVNLSYYAPAGAWVVNASVQDNNAQLAYNTTQTFLLGTLNAFTMNLTALTWPGSITTASTDVLSNNDPLYLNNTANGNGLQVNISGLNLLGYTDPTYKIAANNFTVWNTTSECTGTYATALANASYVRVNNGTLNRGLGATGQEELLFCLRGVPSEDTAQTYNTTGYGSWTVLIG